MTQNAVDFMRKYADLISEGTTQPEAIQLDEGVVGDLINWAKNKAQSLFSQMSPEHQKTVVDLVGKATGGEKPTFNMDTIKSVAAQLQPEIPAIQQQIKQAKGQQPQATVAESMRDTLDKVSAPATAAGATAAGAGAAGSWMAANAAGNAAAAAVPYTFSNFLAHSVAQAGAFQAAALSGQLLAVALGALCVILAIFAWNKFHKTPDTAKSQTDINGNEI